MTSIALLSGALVACESAPEFARTSSTGETTTVPAGTPGDVTGLIAPALDAKQQESPAEVRPASSESGAARNAAAPAPAAGAGAQAAPESVPAMPSLDFLGRSIIRTGTIELEVESVTETFERVSSIATSAGGFVSESRFFGRQVDPTIAPRAGAESRETDAPIMRTPQGGATLTLRVPANRFDDVVAQLRGVAAEVRSISTGSQDVTGDVTDLESTLRNLRAVEARYIEMLGSARTTAEILQVQDRLNQTRAQIERADGRLAGLRRLADMSTLTVSLSPVSPPSTDTPAGTFAPVGEAWQASLEALRSLALGVLVALAFGWWMVPLGALAVWTAVRLLRSTTAKPRAFGSIDTPQGTA
ncbi:MAG: DUF4349 domain-containing protein [Dehalococcoidia bacterium]|nr:DUF4349 domain-containing protein [Dehalococcoidia bacterium]